MCRRKLDLGLFEFFRRCRASLSLRGDAPLSGIHRRDNDQGMSKSTAEESVAVGGFTSNTPSPISRIESRTCRREM